MAEEQTIFMICLEVKAILKREKEKVFVSSEYLDLKPPYSAGWLQGLSYGVCNALVSEV